MLDAKDRKFMKKALASAKKGIGLASPNPCVGCVVVQGGEVVGSGWHEYDLLDHAEVAALREASERASGATVYVTLEPCCFQGRTPPCVDRLIESRVQRVVVGRIDPNPRVSGQGIELLRAAGIQVDVGLMQEECAEIIEPFACRITTGLPLVVSKVGMSLDGKIGTSSRVDRWITSPEGREFGQRLRLGADALLVGAGTILSDNPELSFRGKQRKARPLTRVILDSRLQTPPDARLFQTSPAAPVLIFCTSDAAHSGQAELEREGVEVLTVPSTGDELHLESVLQELGKRGISEVLVEGGSRVHWSFLSSRLVDKFYFIVAPLVLGGENAVPSVGGKGYEIVSEAPRFRIRRSFYAGPDVVLETYPAFSRSIISPWLSSEETPYGAQGLLRSSRPK